MFTEARGIHHIKRLIDTYGNLYGIIIPDKGQAKLSVIENSGCCNVCFTYKQEYRLMCEEKTSGVSRSAMELYSTRFGSKDLCYTKIGSLREQEAKVFVFDEKGLEAYDAFFTQNRRRIEAQSQEKYDPYVILLAMLCKKPNTVLWAVGNVLSRGVSIQHFLSVYKLFSCCENYASRWLSRGTVTAYNGSKDIILLEKELVDIRLKKRVCGVINEFNTTQKKNMRSAILSEDDKKTLSKFSVLSEEKRRNFIRKCSTISDYREIMKLMGVITNKHFEWSKDSLKDYIAESNSLKCDIVFEEGDFVLVKVKNFNTIKYLAKTTNWCISKSRQYWDSYSLNGKNTQYVAFDFSAEEDSPMSIVGFTVSDGDKISFAHDFNNANIRKDNKRFPSISTFCDFGAKGINGFLDKHNVPHDILFDKKRNILFDWSIDHAVECFIEKWSEGFNIVFVNDKSVVVRASGRNMTDLLFSVEDSENIACPRRETESIAIFDFTKKEDDPSRLVMCVLGNNSATCTEFCLACYDANADESDPSFMEEKVFELGLPYDIICRENVKSVARKILCDPSINITPNLTASIVNGLKDDNHAIVEMLSSSHGKRWCGFLQQSLRGLLTFDLIDEILKRGGFDKIFGKESFINILVQILYNICEIPSKEELSMFKSRKNITRYEVMISCAMLTAVEKIMSTASPETIIRSIIKLDEYEIHELVIGKVIEECLPFINGKCGAESLKALVEFAESKSLHDVVSMIASETEKSSNL